MNGYTPKSFLKSGGHILIALCWIITSFHLYHFNYPFIISPFTQKLIDISLEIDELSFEDATPEIQKKLARLHADASTYFWIHRALSFSEIPWLWLTNLDNKVKDMLMIYGQRPDPDPRLVYLCIDNSSFVLDKVWDEEVEASEGLQLMKQRWPWPRKVYPLILDKLFSAEPRAVVLDLLFFSESPDPEDDKAFKSALERYADRIVIGSNFVNTSRAQGSNTNTTNTAMNIPAHSLITQSRPLDPRIGYVNFWPDLVDNVIRRCTFTLMEHQLFLREPAQGDHEFYSLAERAIRKSGLSHQIPKEHDYHLFKYSSTSYRPISIYEIFLPQAWEKNFANGSFFKDKIILIGPEGNWSHDEHDTPVKSSMPGPEVHLNAISAGLNGHFIGESSRISDMLIILASGLLTLVNSIIFKNPFLKALNVVLGLVAYVSLLYVCFNTFSFTFTALYPLANFTLCASSCIAYEYFLERREKQKVRRTLEKYVSKNVVKEILDSDTDLAETLGGKRKPVTIMFSDVRGFTTMTESADAQELVRQLNEYLTEMVSCVFITGGTLDKFIGDAVMAEWGNVTSAGIAEDARQSVRCALLMRDKLDELNTRWLSEGRMELKFGIGINQGDVIAGNMGSLDRQEFTVIGDAVNLAARLEGQTKTFHQWLLLGESVAELVKDAFVLQSVGLIQGLGY